MIRDVEGVVQYLSKKSIVFDIARNKYAKIWVTLMRFNASGLNELIIL